MTNKIYYCTIFILSFLSCTTEVKTDTEKLEKSKLDKIDALGNRYLELGRFSGTILVAINHATVYNQSFGMADYENKIPFTNKTSFKIGEITTLITDNIIHKLIKKGTIKLTDKLSNYLKDFKPDYTIYDVMNNKMIDDYNTLGKLIEQVSGKSYQNNIQQYCDNVALEHTYFDKKDPDIAIGYRYHNYRGKGLELQKSPSYNLDTAYSSKGVKSTANDLIKILKTSTEELDISGYLDDDGFSYSILHELNNKTSIIVLSNRKQPITDEISNSIKAILENKKYRLPLPRKPFDIDNTTLKEFSGKYSMNEHVTFEVVNTKDSLFVLLGPQKTQLIPQSSNQFYMQQMDASMRFMKDSTGIVNRVLLLNGFIDSNELATRIE